MKSTVEAIESNLLAQSYEPSITLVRLLKLTKFFDKLLVGYTQFRQNQPALCWSASSVCISNSAKPGNFLAYARQQQSRVIILCNQVSRGLIKFPVIYISQMHKMALSKYENGKSSFLVMQECKIQFLTMNFREFHKIKNYKNKQNAHLAEIF